MQDRLGADEARQGRDAILEGGTTLQKELENDSDLCEVLNLLDPNRKRKWLPLGPALITVEGAKRRRKYKHFQRAVKLGFIELAPPSEEIVQVGDKPEWRLKRLHGIKENTYSLTEKGKSALPLVKEIEKVRADEAKLHRLHTRKWYKENFGVDPLELGLPFVEVANPYYRSAGAPMKLWEEQAVLPYKNERGIEQFKKRHESGKKAAVTKEIRDILDQMLDIKQSQRQNNHSYGRKKQERLLNRLIEICGRDEAVRLVESYTARTVAPTD